MRLTLLRFLRVNLCCVSRAPNGPIAVSNRQKQLDMVEISDPSNVSSQPRTGSAGVSKNKGKKGIFVEKIPPRMDGKDLD